MSRHEETGKSREVAFGLAFGVKYVRSTFNDNERAWRAAGLIDGEQARWIAKGYTKQGEWREFMKIWRQGSK